MATDIPLEFKSALGLPSGKLTCLAWKKRKECPCNQALSKRANARIESTIRAIIAKGPAGVTGPERYTGDGNTSDPLWSLAECLVCSRHVITTQVEYVAKILAERLVAWHKETASCGEAAEEKTAEEKTAASAGCPDLLTTLAKNTTSGTQCPKVLLEGLHTDENGTDIGSDSSEGTSSTSSRQTSWAKLGHLLNSTPTRPDILPSPASFSTTTPTDSIIKPKCEFSTPLTPQTPTTAGGKTEPYFPKVQRRDQRSYDEESPTQERSARSPHITFDATSDIRNLTLTGSEEESEESEESECSEESEDVFYTPQCVSNPGQCSQDDNEPSFENKAHDGNTLHPPNPKKARRISAPEAMALRSEGSKSLDIKTAEPTRRGRRRTLAAHNPGTTPAHSRNGSPGLDPRGIVFEGADDNDHVDPPSGTERYSLKFQSPAEKKNVTSILEKMWATVGPESLRPGFIYCFRDKTTPGYLKIGYTAIEKNSERYSNPDKLPFVETKDPHVLKRLRDFKKECRLDMDIQFATFMPCSARRMETLIHTTLHIEKRIVVNCICGTSHKEWFRLSVDEARAVVEEWRKFSGLRPYCQKGRVEPFWHDYAVSNSMLFEKLNPRQWLVDHLRREISREARRKRMEELEGQLERSREETRFAQLALEGAEAQLSKASGKLSVLRGKEKGIEQELEALRKRV